MNRLFDIQEKAQALGYEPGGNYLLTESDRDSGIPNKLESHLTTGLTIQGNTDV